MILILYSLFGFQVIVIQRQCLSVDYRERLDGAKPERATARTGKQPRWVGQRMEHEAINANPLLVDSGRGFKWRMQK